MSQPDISFDRQELTIQNARWNVILNYENWASQSKEIESNESYKILELSEPGEWDSILKMKIDDSKGQKICFIKGIDGGSYLHKADNKDSSQSVKIEGDSLIMSLGFYFISVDLINLTLNWNLRPDIAEVFEFYDLQNDYLLRGELQIHRIDKQGNVKWSYGG